MAAVGANLDAKRKPASCAASPNLRFDTPSLRLLRGLGWILSG